MSTIAERLRKARERKNLRQTQVKAQTGINNKTLSGYENGVSEPDLDTLKRLAELYEVTVDWLTGMTESRTPPGGGAEDIDKQILQELRRISEEDREYLFGLLKRMPNK